MHLDDFVRPVSTQLQAAAALGDERTQQIAASLAASADAAVRLAVIHAVSTAAAETSFALQQAGGAGAPSVAVHLDGDDLNVQVTPGPADEPPAAPADEGDATARISLRLTDALKSELEQAAARDGLSVNGWLIRAAMSALAHRRPAWPGADPTGGRGAHRVNGWVTG